MPLSAGRSLILFVFLCEFCAIQPKQQGMDEYSLDSLSGMEQFCSHLLYELVIAFHGPRLIRQVAARVSITFWAIHHVAPFLFRMLLFTIERTVASLCSFVKTYG
jgi:hypothetical protein